MVGQQQVDVSPFSPPYPLPRAALVVTRVSCLLPLSCIASHFFPAPLQIPHNLGALAKLEVLDLSNNRFDGSLPPSMESLQQLNTFSASNNDLSGDLPSFLGGLTLLTCLALNGNQFSGSMPRELGKLTLLKRLYLEKNELVRSEERGLLP